MGRSRRLFDDKLKKNLNKLFLFSMSLHSSGAEVRSDFFFFFRLWENPPKEDIHKSEEAAHGSICDVYIGSNMAEGF